MSMRKFDPTRLVLFAVLLGVLGCGGKSVNITCTVSPTPTISLDSGQSVTFTATVTGDSSNAGVNWTLIAPGALSNQSTTSVTYTAPAVIGVSTSAVVATPVKDINVSASTAINLSPLLTVAAPSLPAAKAAIAYSYQLVSAGGSAPIAWSVTSGALPAGLSLSASGLLSGTPTATGPNTFTITATDSAMTPVSVAVPLTLTVATPTLSITSTSVPNGITGSAYSATLTSISGTAPLTWSVASGSLPAGLNLTSAGVLAGTPTGAGAFSFTAQVVDSSTTPQKATAVFSFNIFVPLAIPAATLPDGAIKTVYNATLQSTGGAAPIKWAVTSGALPAGLALSSVGVISGTPTATGTSTFTVQASDSYLPQQTATASYTLSVVLSTLAISTASLSPGTVGTAYNATLASTGGNAPVTWAISSGTLPPGLSLSSAGVISGSPTASNLYSFTVQATDSTPASVTKSLSINVVLPSTLKITTTSLASGNIASPYSATLGATLGNPPYTWSLSSGTLPAGVNLSSAGILSGTPYVAGTYNLTVAVTDSTSATVTAVLPLTIGTTLAPGPGNSRLSGGYAFLVSGFQSGSGVGKTYGFAIAGSLIADGLGGISGVEDINNSAGVQTALPLTGSYSLGNDGRGLLVLTAGTTTTVYTVAASNTIGGIAQSIAISEFDNADGTGSTASGFGKHQTAAAFSVSTLNGTFAFGLSGESPCVTCFTPSPRFGPLVAAGVFTADGSSNISGGAEDASAYGQNYTGITLKGTFTAPASTTGRGTLTVAYTGTIFSAPPTTYTYLIVGTNELILLSNASHATTALLFGDAQLQQQTTFSGTSFTGTSIGYESRPTGGNGSSIYPVALNATLMQLTNTGSGTALFLQDSNNGGTMVSGTAAAITYTTAANGRTIINTGTNHTLYLYDIGTGFGIDLATSTTYPSLVRYELQVATPPVPPVLYGSYAVSTLASPVAVATASGTDNFTFYSGGINNGVDGKVASLLDSSTVAGTLSLATVGTSIYSEDLTGRFTLSDFTNATPAGILYSITTTRAVSIPASSASTPVVSVLQQ